MGYTSGEIWEFFLVHFASRRLDRESLEYWELNQESAREPATLKQFEKFLENRARALELVNSSFDCQSPGKHNSSINKPKAVVRSHAVGTTGLKCPYCQESHFLSLCVRFSGRTVADRLSFVKAKRLCFNCLGNHSVTDCRNQKRCRTCQGKHHTLIHPNDANPSNMSDSKSLPINQEPNSLVDAARVNCVKSPPKEDNTILPTANLFVKTRSGDIVKVRAFLDQGSQISMIRESLMQALQLPRFKTTLPLVGIASTYAGKTKGSVHLQFCSVYNQNRFFNVTAHILPKLTDPMPANFLNSKNWSHLKDLELADVDYDKPGRIDLIIGARLYGHLIEPEIRRRHLDEPVAQYSAFGWIVSGPVCESEQKDLCQTLMAVNRSTEPEDRNLHQLLTQFWEQEEVKAPTHGMMSTEDKECEEHFSSTHSRDETGRYIVKLPFRLSPDRLGESRDPALQLLNRMQRRIERDPRFGQLYSEFLTEYLNLGHMTAVDPLTDQNTAVFLPHHGVLRESSLTTKLRDVFNGSKPTSNGLSLNDCLHSGPKLQNDLADTILHWRRYQFVFVADIVKMFRQIVVHSDDRKYQQILWSSAGTTQAYQLNTVTYGLACAPYLALRVLHQLASDERESFPLAEDIVKTEMYMDDVLSGGNTLVEAKEKALQISNLLMAGGFQLQKWMASNPMVLEKVYPNDATRPFFDLKSDQLTRTLGLSWDPLRDIFIFKVEKLFDFESTTKRAILSHIAQLFDPLGWLTPVTIVAKMFMQNLWRSNLGWDDPIPSSLMQPLLELANSFSSVETISIPRWMGLVPNCLSVQLQGFSDASQDAISAVVYLRVIDSSNNIGVSLLSAKSKVAPLKKQTIPRLELAAAVLLTKLIERLLKVLKLPLIKVYLWTDSTVTLTWIQGEPCKWKEFVANRVALIQSSLPNANWRHIAGDENPADCASRGLTPIQLSHHHLWWQGPSWLAGPESDWPSNDDYSVPEAQVATEAKTIRSCQVRVSPPELWSYIFRFSSWSKLVRVTSWVRRAIAKFRKLSTTSSAELSVLEIRTAEHFIIKHFQTAYFDQEIRSLSKGTTLGKTHTLFKLSPFIDGEGMLRMGGRLKYSNLDPEVKHPIILPKDCYLATLIIREIHLSNLHSGVQLTLASLRQRYWLIGGRRAVKNCIHFCVPCTRHRAKLATQLMGQLPINRVNPGRSFLTAGVDYAGPFSIKIWKGRTSRSYKGFLVVFVCFVTSAVHLELATDYSSAGFLAAFRRFISRRGLCAEIHSDCGSNLVGADRQLRELFKINSNDMAYITRTLTSLGTEWKFNPPGAPHFGGKWEAAVKSVKHHIKRVLGTSILTYEEFNTLLTQVEAVLNSRPLCAISDDPSDLEPLTPGHFLIGSALNTVPGPSLMHQPYSRLNRWQRVQQFLERIWRRWSTEYLQGLQELTKWQKQSDNIKKGSLVLIADERTAPSIWPLARVVETHPGQDGLVRVVTLKTASTILKRPVVKLCPLPIN